MISLQFCFIFGVSVGFEILTEEDDDIAWALIMDFAIVRFVVSKFI